MAETPDNRRAQLEALRQSLIRRGAARAGGAAADASRACGAAEDTVETRGAAAGGAAAAAGPSARRAVAPDVAPRANIGAGSGVAVGAATMAPADAAALACPGEREVRDAVRRAALARLKGRGRDEAGADVPAGSEAAAAFAGGAGASAATDLARAARPVPASAAGAAPAAPTAPAFGAHSVSAIPSRQPAAGAHSAGAAPAAPAAVGSAPAAPAAAQSVPTAPAAPAAAVPAASAAPAATIPAARFTIPATDAPAPAGAPAASAPAEAGRTMREYVGELLNPKKDRGANVLTEPDHEAIAQGKGRHYAKTGGHARSLLAFVLEFLLIFVIALALIFPLRAFVAEYYYIPSGSMQETLQIDDRILSEKVSYYFSTPQQGQIVTFEGVGDEAGQTLIKRVIAVGGQTVDLRGGAVYVDGEKLDEPYTDGKESRPLSNSLGITYPYKVPEGQIWVMGDNRTNSMDSRAFGPVPIENVTGHAFWRYWPLTSFGALG